MSRPPAVSHSRLDGLETIGDLRRGAARRLPKAIFDTLEGAAGEEEAARRNIHDLRKMSLVPRVLQDVSSVDMSVTVLGDRVASPVLLAPTGFSGLYYPRGELCVARAAAATIHVLSTFSSVSLEEVAQSGSGRRWFQLYPFRSRELMRDLIRRVREARYEALCVTVDVPVVGTRNRDLRNGIRRPGATWRLLLAGVSHPRWGRPFLCGYRPRFGSLLPYLAVTPRRGLSLATPDLNPAFSWPDLEWVLAEWQGPLVIKGILHPDDAERAIGMGARAIMVSNHGGRQFDAAPSTISVLPAIRRRVRERCEIYVDSGLRCGTDVLKFLASGANACLIGRAYLYGLSIAGAAGVSRALEILTRELQTAMQLAGVVNLDAAALRGIARMSDSTSCSEW